MTIHFFPILAQRNPTLPRVLASALAFWLADSACLSAQTINVDVNAGTANNYTGLGIVPGDTGTTWNGLNINSGVTSATIASGSVKDSSGATLAGVSVTIASSNGTSVINRYSTTNNTTPNPVALMRDYTYTGTYNVTVSGLTAGTYQFWFFGHGDATNQTGSVTVDAANGGGSGSTANNALGRDIINGGAGVSYVFLDNLTVDSGGLFKFQVANYLNGFQLKRVGSAPAVDLRPSINADAGNTAYTGTAVAEGSGTVWNQLPSSTATSYSLADVVDSSGNTLSGVGLTVSTTSDQIRAYASDSPGNPNPLNLMRDYFYSGNFTVSLTGLAPGHYFLYVFAHGNNTNQNSTVTVDAANGGGSGTTSATGTDNRDLFAANAEGYSYLKLTPNVGASGALSFTATSYLTGFQLVPYPAPTFTVQPPPTPGAALNADFVMSASASGSGTITYRWRKGGTDLADGPTGNGSTYAGTTTTTLTIQDVRNADAGTYTLAATNPGGATASNAASLTVSATPLAPSISNQPQSVTVSASGSATFNVVANGTAPLTYLWYLGTNPLGNGTTAQGSVVTGADTARLSISNAQLADAGSYHVVVSNSVGPTSSSNATLTVNQAPTIAAQPATAIVASGASHTLSATFGPSFPVPACQWQKSTDGLTWANVSGGTSADLTLPGSLANAGFYRVTATNSVGSATSAIVYFGIPSTQPVTFAPGHGATNLAIDQPLRLVFPSQPKLGHAGVLQIHDAADGSVVAAIDRSTFQSYVVDSATIVNAAPNIQQGTSYYYLPIAIYGNEVWISLSTAQRLSYGKSYYVTLDAALLLDSNNAAYPGVSSPAAWTFSTKAAGPAAPTTTTGPQTITVGMDGTGDFATLQGAADWIPQNNTLPRTIRIRPGLYHEAVQIGQNRRFVTVAGQGAHREDVEFFHPCPATTEVRSAGIIRVSCDDVTVRDLTLDAGIYVAQPSPSVTFGPAIPAFPGRVNVIYTTGRRLVFENLLVKAGQDTLYANSGLAYFHGCEIWGSTDFIYGSALAVFDDCDIVEIRDSGGPITAPSTAFAQPYGEVFLNCRFPRALVADGYPYNVNVGSTTFMRPWRQDGATAVVNCRLGTHISTKGWSEWSATEGEKAVTCRAREIGSALLGGGAAPTLAQRQAAGAYWLNTIDPDYDAPAGDQPLDTDLAPGTGTSNRIAVTVDSADFTLAAIFGHPYFNLEGWMPTWGPRITAQPQGQTVDPGGGATFVVTATGTPAPTFQWFRNGVPIQDATGASLVLSNLSVSQAGSYTVVATNSAGSAESNTASLVVNDPLAIWAGGFGLDPATTGAPGADPDADGLSNLVEFAFGLDPTKPAAGGLVLDGGTIIARGLPVSHLGSGWTIRFLRRKTRILDGITYVAQFSGNLSAWEESAALPTVLASDAESEVVEVPFPEAFSGSSGGFARIRLEASP